MALQQIPISKFGFIRLTRDEVVFVSSQNLEENKDIILANCMPFGHPQKESVKFVEINRQLYLCFSKFNFKNDNGYGLIVQTDSNFYDKVKIHQIYPGLRSLISTEKEFEKNSKLQTLIIPRKELITEKLDLIINNLDGILFSIFARTPIVLVGTHEEVLKYYGMFNTLLPKWVVVGFTFVSQTGSLSENVSVIGISPKDEIIKGLQRIGSPKRTIIFIRQNKTFSPNTSNYCRKLAKTLNDNDFSRFYLKMDKLFSMVKQYDYESVQQASDTLKIGIDDAKLLYAMKQAQSGNPIKPDEIDNLR
ncbi:MAG: hypothetical protein ACTSO7_06125 [Candidatus Heimdallarchaeota archaeon]